MGARVSVSWATNPTKINGLRKEISKVEAELQELVEQKAQDLGVTVASIDLALEDLGWNQVSSRKVDLEKIDSSRKMRSLYVQIKRLEKGLQEEKEKP